jgi:hypothetical protein
MVYRIELDCLSVPDLIFDSVDPMFDGV